MVELSRNPDAYTDLAQGAMKTLNEALPQTSKELAETVAAGVDTAQAALKEGITSKEAIKTLASNAANGAMGSLNEDIPETFEALQNTINAGRRTVNTALQEGDKETLIKTGRKILNEQGSELLERMPNSKESIKASEIVSGVCDKATKTTNKYLKIAAGAALLLIPAGFGIGALIDKGIDKSKTAKENAQDSTQS